MYNEPEYSISYKIECDPSEDTDKPVHTRSLITVFTGHYVGTCHSLPAPKPNPLDPPDIPEPDPGSEIPEPDPDPDKADENGLNAEKNKAEMERGDRTLPYLSSVGVDM